MCVTEFIICQKKPERKTLKFDNVSMYFQVDKYKLFRINVLTVCFE